EGHRPRKTLHPTRAYASHARQLHGDGEDGERDQRLDRFWWDVDEPEHGEGERHDVSGRERRDSPQQPAASPHEQHESEHEEQMIRSAHDVLEAIPREPARTSERPAASGDVPT